jgi:uncharacterized protein (DUF983 family)
MAGFDKTVERIYERRTIMTTPQHCPGWEQFKNLKAFTCKCPNCGKEKEIFSDEFNKTHTCSGCGKEIDFTQCTLEAGK